MSVHFLLLCLVAFTIVAMIMAENQTDSKSRKLYLSDEKKLTKMLNRRYDKLGQDGRPVMNNTQSVKVFFGLGLIKMELHEKENMLSMSTWARYRWKDAYLTWNPDDYGGVTMVKLSPERIWLPDVMLYNTAETGDGVRKVMVVVMYDGTVSWYPHKMFQSSCAIDVRNFPFDNQTCHMWFGSWTHSVAEVDLDLAFPGGIDLSTFQSVYKDASEWDIINATAERIVMPPEDTPQYAILSFTVMLGRKMMFSTYILTMPAIFLSFLTLLVFWLPPEHADKSALGLTIFGSLLLLLLILVEAAPPTASAVPLLGVYYCFTTVIVILSIFLSSLVIKVGRNGKKHRPVPRWIKVVVLDVMARILCLRFTSCACLKKSKSIREMQLQTSSEKERLESRDRDVVISRDLFDDLRLNGSGGNSGLYILEKRLRSMHYLISDVIKKQNDKEEKEKHHERIENQWRNVALVMDRFFFITYLIGILISLFLLFPRYAVEYNTSF